MLITAIFLATANKAIVDYLAEPIRQRWPSLNLWWLAYVALATGSAIGWLSGANLFGEYIPEEIAGRVLTAVIIGGGSSLINDLFNAGVARLKPESREDGGE